MELRHRLFFALLPPSLERGRIGWQRDRLGHAGSIVTNDRLHLTLAITDDFEHFPNRIAQHLIAAAGSVITDPAMVALDRLSAGNRSVALRPSRRSPSLAALGRELSDRLRRLGLMRAGWSFSPHVTLLYRPGRPFQQPVEPIVWQASDFVLIHSIVGATQHIELGRWPLASRQLSLDF